MCVAVDYGGYAVVYNGRRWTKPAWIDHNLQLWSVSWPATSFCAAVDTSGYVVTYNGHRWTAPKLIDSHPTLWAVSCLQQDVLRRGRHQRLPRHLQRPKVDSAPQGRDSWMGPGSRRMHEAD
jgi:hypothetical protein